MLITKYILEWCLMMMEALLRGSQQTCFPCFHGDLTVDYVDVIFGLVPNFHDILPEIGLRAYTFLSHSQGEEEGHGLGRTTNGGSIKHGGCRPQRRVYHASLFGACCRAKIRILNERVDALRCCLTHQAHLHRKGALQRDPILWPPRHQ